MHMNRTVLQVPVTVELRREAEREAMRQGFSSLQDLVRIFLRKLADGLLRVNLEESVELSPRAIKRYDKMSEEIHSGKVKPLSFSNTKSLMKSLNTRK